VLKLALVLVRPAMGGVMEENNKKTVHDFYEMAVNEHLPALAAKMYIGDRYIQHHPGVPDGADAFCRYFETFFHEYPNYQVEIKHIVAEGDLVVLHLHGRKNEQDRGRAIVDIFRLESGKIIEHWDVIQDVPEMPAGGNTMF
jgi:predicted SnoaL-like aldol condensation-catalyzing enzyme